MPYLAIPAPCAWINTNDRTHHMARARLTRTWREAACLYARAVRLAPMGAVEITAYVHRTRKGRVDSPNYYPTIKAAIDGIVDAGMLVDDHDGIVRALTFRPGGNVSAREYPHGLLVLEITEVEA